MDSTDKLHIEKPGIWRISQGGSQAKRIVRVKEFLSIMDNIEVDENRIVSHQGLFKVIDLKLNNAQRWFKFLLFTGMRFSEAYRLLLNEGKYNGKELFNPERHTIWYVKELGELGKGKVINKERIIFLSDVGVRIAKEFFDKASIPRLLSASHKRVSIDQMAIVMDNVLKHASLKAGLPTRQFSMTRKEYTVDALGVRVKGENGKYLYTKKQVPMKEPTTGCICRSLRATWESYLVAMFMSDPLQILNITGSMGHDRTTAETYYIIAGQFDNEDLDDIKSITKGWGKIPDKNQNNNQ